MPTPLQYLKRDLVLSGLIRRYPEQILPPPAKTLFEPLVKTVIQQQVRFSVAQVIIERMQGMGDQAAFPQRRSNRRDSTRAITLLGFIA